MIKETLIALEASLSHWENDFYGDGLMKGGDCALCQRFQFDCQTSDGEKCPVYEKTGEEDCLGTPYTVKPDINQRNEEIAFLKSLLLPWRVREIDADRVHRIWLVCGPNGVLMPFFRKYQADRIANILNCAHAAGIK